MPFPFPILKPLFYPKSEHYASCLGAGESVALQLHEGGVTINNFCVKKRSNRHFVYQSRAFEGRLYLPKPRFPL